MHGTLCRQKHARFQLSTTKDTYQLRVRVEQKKYKNTSQRFQGYFQATPNPAALRCDSAVVTTYRIKHK